MLDYDDLNRAMYQNSMSEYRDRVPTQYNWSAYSIQAPCYSYQAKHRVSVKGATNMVRAK